ncbi:endonuclease/exonuclease/phosphatase family protein [Rubrimonas cliftonensis]|uniref:Endonuclease/Exonuclease/phosphatase family protein n=1 Tax=Rubrimonas cliftonensis TaxID=89524 RepID=A0A1H4ENJ0_9RHOB|nr:endonuclease/exonuclease/phosphatase family protein [Rubrimonas cliftonensis]SEA86581.1 Endonuclease/Exonuclease/phosphatase family protein [Rubrimonas cliftonensis]
MTMRPTQIAALLALAAGAADAQALRVMTWNINGAEATPAALEENARGALAELGPVDVVMLQEVISQDQVAAIARGFGLEHHAISDFSPPPSITRSPFSSLEVAVISRTPILGAAEWDPTGRDPNGDGFAPRVSDAAAPVEELPIDVTFADDTPDRGFLRVDLDGELSVYAVHWKSSRGESCNAADLLNALQREEQAEGLAQDLARRLSDPARTVIVGGDFNIQAPGRAARVGMDLGSDCAPAGSCDGVCGADGLDGYDDSISALLAGVSGARLLSADLDNTFIGRFFPGGAIDHLVVAGARAGAFQLASTPVVNGSSFFGSDHRPVLATASDGETDGSDRARIRALIDEMRARLTELEALIGR